MSVPALLAGLLPGIRVMIALAAAGCLAGAVFLAAREIAPAITASRMERRLGAFMGEKEEKAGSSVSPARFAQPSPVERFIPLAGGAAVALASLIFIPPIIALALGGVAGFFIHDLLRTRRMRFIDEMQGSLPLLLMRFAENLRVQANVEEALNGALNTLTPGNPLRVYLEEVLRARKEEGHGVLMEAAKEAEGVLPAVATALVALYHLWQVGGPGFPEAFIRFASAISQASEIKRQAGAKGAGARRAVAMVAGSLVVVFTGLLLTPAIRSIIQRPIIQLLYAGLLGMMALGWHTMQSMVEEATR